jgi:hypothetical protein
MVRLENLLKRAVLHPFLLATYPIFSLVAYNLGEVTPVDALRSVLASIGVAVVLLLSLRALLQDWQKAAILVALFEIAFFSYGHIYSTIEDARLFGLLVGRHRTLLFFWIGVLVLVVWWERRKKRGELGGVTRALNLISAVLILFPIYQALAYETRTIVAQAYSGAFSAGGETLNELAELEIAEGQAPPDIYYIILDAYTREDTFHNYFGYDNRPFIDRLEKMGFYVAPCSQSNYSRTQLSIASSLNMDYLEAFGSGLESVNNSTVLNNLILHNRVRQVLERLGYRTVVLESGYSPTEWKDADAYFSLSEVPGETNFVGGINPFEALLLRTSPGIYLYELKPRLSDKMQTFLDTAYIEHRDRILYTLDKLEKLPSFDGPKFIFAHIIAPHEPFVFGPHGEIVERKTPFALNHDIEARDTDVYLRGYRDQVIYLNSRLEPLLQKIIAQSQTPPIIIVQGDHGPLVRVSSPNARMTIFNAYYFPGEGAQRLYPSISPVNSFRVILDETFEGKLGLIEDVSYYFDTKSKQFSVSPNENPSCGAPENQLER